jgi:hypothetical protein
MEDKVVITIAIELADGLLSILPVDKVDETKAPARSSLLIHRDIDTADRAKCAEQLEDVRLTGVL